MITKKKITWDVLQGPRACSDAPCKIFKILNLITSYIKKL